MADRIRTAGDLCRIRDNYLENRKKYKTEVLVCGGAACASAGCRAVHDALKVAVEKNGLEGEVLLTVTGCMGMCARGPLVLVNPGETLYVEMNPQKVEEVAMSHLLRGRICTKYTYYDSVRQEYVPKLSDIAFFSDQQRVVLRNCGRMDFSSLGAYIARDGYVGLAAALSGSPEKTIKEIGTARLRGRGGAGFPTALKWKAARDAASPDGMKYVICNADEGDPGAFMDRSILEGDPHSIIEGMLIAGYAIGAKKGIIYVRAEYPLADGRIRRAVSQAREAGLLGEDILGAGFSFELEVVSGAGAFICGEETALLASIEGRRGEPHQRPPYPFENGLMGAPTVVNNVETLANVPPIITKGGAWFASIGTPKSRGTKVFSLSGRIANSGIIEVPMGTRIGDIVYRTGGGIIGGRELKAVQIGGPSGGCLTREHLNTRIEYEALSGLGVIMGSGGLIVLDDGACMVDTARFFMDFISNESCGKCVPCRIGTVRMKEILDRIAQGRGRPQDMGLLENLAINMKKTAFCGLGRTAPNPVLSTLKFFRHEYESHIFDSHCPSGVCAELQTAPCSNACPAGVDVPGFIRLFAAGRPEDAYRLIRMDNPFPSVCGRVCTRPCEVPCVRGSMDEPIMVAELERFIGDYIEKDEGMSAPLMSPPTGKHVAVIGAGPSGLSCAYFLALMGHEVDVYEADAVSGGVLFWGIPEFRLPQVAVYREIKAIEQVGVSIHLHTRIGREVEFEELRGQSDAVYVATGSQISRQLGIPGEELSGVESGLGFRKRIGTALDMGIAENIIVVGGGSTAMDAARTAVRLGARSVTVIYRRAISQMQASPDEVAAAMDEGVNIIPMTSPVRFLGANGHVTGVRLVKRRLADYGSDGMTRTVAIGGTEYEMPCDGVITAINQDSELDIYMGDPTASGAAVDRLTMMTELEGVFAGGDSSPWGKNVVINAIADGKKAAINIDRYLGGSGECPREDIDIPEMLDVDDSQKHGRFPVRQLAPDDRKKNFREVNCGYHRLDAMGEAHRCLHCDRR